MSGAMTIDPTARRSRFHTEKIGPRRRVRADQVSAGDVLPRRGEVVAVFASIASSTPDMRLFVLRQANGGIDSTRYAAGSTLEVIKGATYGVSQAPSGPRPQAGRQCRRFVQRSPCPCDRSG